MSDEAVNIGPPAAPSSYLAIDRILEAALQTGADAIHPGYGFLAENARFAQAAEQAGLVFIGPPAEAIQAMGDKAEARLRMQTAGIPVVPGYQGDDDLESLQSAAQSIGYPLLVKAVAGGGGKGMRVVRQPAELLESIASAQREALKAFDDQRVILERYIPHARHIEFQILADSHGRTYHLFERECSLQRRHQKIIEETPSPLLDSPAAIELGLRQKMGAAAIAAAQAVDYQNAGTVEFIVDPDTLNYYFLEMNTRLQVEHPITELVSGLDLVQWQIKIAEGEPLAFSQSQIGQRGHAIECRLYAEDPANGFLPATGPLLRFIEPQGPGIRVDTGVTSGDEITIHYDPLIAKLIAHAETRQTAITRMQNALRETVLLGIRSNWQFLQDVLSDPEYQSGRVYTTWIEERFDNWQPPQCGLPPEVLVAAALSTFQGTDQPHQGPQSDRTGKHRDPYSPWHNANEYRVGE
jgi:acetyl/propionyl-CoA carboxylase alpha subunit